ncbi:hypothetical protein NP233_g8487 [Leucocoprinus birnbaumii]|uniref:Uncharacterized protein n=1 Tax=Leucocoprinus birnbaumii TaxID=56174 RepID=A0AAD5YN43_9AGAR|nr:hypothetical protein NP233_g8487 [Leucocoprinus birnbaumii]
MNLSLPNESNAGSKTCDACEQEPGDLSAFTYPELPELPTLMYSDDEEDEEDEYEGLEWQSDGEDDDYDMDFQAFEDTVFPLGPDQWGTITDRVDDSNHGSNDIESIGHEANDSEDDQDVDVECPLIDDGHGLKPACSLHYSEKHRRSRAGCIISESEESDACYASAVKETKKAEQNPWAPFASRMDWDVAKWAKLRNIGSTDLSELLAIEGLCNALGLSYKNTRELNNIVDNLPTIPKFQEREVVIDGETIIFHSRDIVACLKHLWRDPELVDDLILEPEQQWADKERTSRLYHEMNTGDWWWTTQAEVEKATGDQHATVVPIILSSDKTQLTMFRNKQAYPVYMTLGNIPKHIHRKPSRQVQVLLAYLPTTKLEHISNKALCRHAISNLFHTCMQFIVKPLEHLSKTGIELTSGDGAVR